MNGILVLGLALVSGFVLVGCWLGWQLLRQNGRILLRLDELEKRLDESEFGGAEEPEGLPVGHEAPAFELPDLDGARKTLAQFHGQPVLLVFFNPECGFCQEMMPKLAALDTERGRSPSAAVTNSAETPKPVDGVVPSEPLRTGTVRAPSVLILTTGDANKNRQFFAEHKIRCPVLLQNDGEVAKTYQANGTPTGYLVSADGKIASQLAIGAEALLALAVEPRSSRREEARTEKSEVRNPKSEQDQSLLTSAATDGDGRATRFGNHSLARSKIKRDGLKAGTPAPDFRMPRVDGRGDLTLSELRGKRVLLVFSSPHCGPCDALAPELEKFHRLHPELEMVMISKGEPKENRAKVKEHGLTLPVVLQRQWEISRLYAMFATPVAYLIDETGTIAHDVAVGVEPILALMARTKDACREPTEVLP